MTDSAVTPNDAIECFDDKGKKYTIRSGGHKLLSYQSLFSVGKLLVGVIGVTIAMLTAYYTAEASQDAVIHDVRSKQDTLLQQQITSDKKMTEVLERIDAKLERQIDLLGKTRESLIRVETRQQGIAERTTELTNKVDSITDRVTELGRP